eukprot:gnl/TRDRNA2_/TRDRNA2_175109_c0_seq7.p1 gnl/TRDRNA2_/TRDRNA2_175109_c0~~gnl/TRDRNA2_/TRDRNA2_175109_c0_seq7.p1  ORF type:complete len:267 (+),score=24.98 gnl/TRDRNA2_/TRDRNA2_175109_c0_seq7:80-880(+)
MEFFSCILFILSLATTARAYDASLCPAYDLVEQLEPLYIIWNRSLGDEAVGECDKDMQCNLTTMGPADCVDGICVCKTGYCNWLKKCRATIPGNYTCVLSWDCNDHMEWGPVFCHGGRCMCEFEWDWDAEDRTCIPSDVDWRLIFNETPVPEPGPGTKRVRAPGAHEVVHILSIPIPVKEGEDGREEKYIPDDDNDNADDDGDSDGEEPVEQSAVALAVRTCWVCVAAFVGVLVGVRFLQQRHAGLHAKGNQYQRLPDIAAGLHCQ